MKESGTKRVVNINTLPLLTNDYKPYAVTVILKAFQNLRTGWRLEQPALPEASDLDALHV